MMITGGQKKIGTGGLSVAWIGDFADGYTCEMLRNA